MNKYKISIIAKLKNAKINEPMSLHTSFKIGGPADVMVFPGNIDELNDICHIARDNKIPVFVLGAGSNLLVKDGGISGVVVNMKGFKKITLDNNLVYAEAGVRLPLLVNHLLKNRLTGMEFLAGIPGTVGGAVMMNAGAWGKEMADVIDNVRILDHDGKIRDVKRNEISFYYRHANIKGGIIVGVSFILRTADQNKIENEIKNHLENRKKSQPINSPSAGSIFKNPEGDYAGRLIENLGLKKYQIGGAQVSEKHANFIINKGHASATEVIKIIRYIGSMMEKKKGVTLELEIMIVGRS